jgi:hypothetical protein
MRSVASIPVQRFLWKKKVSYTWIHNHKKAFSTWSHAHRVIKFGYLTLKQAQRNFATTKNSCSLLRSCGNSKIVSPT